VGDCVFCAVFIPPLAIVIQHQTRRIQIVLAAIYLDGQPLTAAVFDVIGKDPGIAGYAIARTLDQNPGLVLDALSSLLKLRLISGVDDMRDNFALTAVGFGVREWMAAQM
jgi:hypothetical protein